VSHDSGRKVTSSGVLGRSTVSIQLYTHEYSIIYP
jgi:hypothetical protein